MDQQKKFDVPEVLAALEAAVAKRGADYVYVNEEGERIDCKYVHYRHSDNPVPGCIVGQVYYDLTGELVPEDSEQEAVDTSGTLVNAFTGKAVDVLRAAQVVQDARDPWGAALAAARHEPMGDEED